MTVICEPQCYGFEHAEVNAALIAVFCSAFPKEEIVFLAETGHLQRTREYIQAHGCREIRFQEIQLAPRRCSHPKRLVLEISVYRKIFARAVQYNADKIVFCAVTAQGLIVTKFLIRFFKSLRCVAVMHGVIETIVDWKEFWRQQMVFWFRFPFLFWNSDRLKYLVFGSFIQESLSEMFPKIRKFVSAMDLPYSFQPPTIHVPSENKTSFGALGVGSRSKGTDLFFKTAVEVKSYSRDAEFILIGPVIDKQLVLPENNTVIIPSLSSPLSREDFSKWAQSIDYAVFFHKPESYRFSTSAAFFDALSYVKPVIAIRNPLFEYYFRLMGDIGYLCASYDEVNQVIKEIGRKFPIERYAFQRENILSGRARLSVPDLAKQIQTIWN